jgi:hypothetical protein
VQATAARLVVGNRQIPATDLLSHLYWLRVAKRIHFEIATLTYKVLTTQQPAYLRSLIHYHVPSRKLRSSALHKLLQPAVHKTVGQRAFSLHSHAFIILSLSQLNLLYSLSSINLKHFYFNSFPSISPIHPLHQ